jgi:ATP-dependent Lon protease
MSRAENELFILRDPTTLENMKLPELVPILPARNTVLFPSSMIPLSIGRESSVKLLEEVNSQDERVLGVVAQRDSSLDDPQEIDLHSIGTLALATKQMRVKDNSLIVAVQGLKRFRIKEYVQTRPFIKARIELLDDVVSVPSESRAEAMRRSVETLFQQVVTLSPGLSADLVTVALNLESLGQLTDFIASVIPSLSVVHKQEFLETLDVWKRLEKLNAELAREAEILELKGKIQSQVQDEVGKNQRDYYLREQLKAIQKELGEGDDTFKEVEELKKGIEEAQLPEEVKTEAIRELKRLARMSQASAEYTVSKTYLDWLVSLPWNKLAQYHPGSRSLWSEED